LLANYGSLGLFIVVAFLVTIALVIIPIVLKYLRIVPYRPNPIKNATVECGMDTIGKTWVQFNFRYYFYALIFLALDVLVVFIYPWAVHLRQLEYSGFFVAIIFVAIIIVGYLYAWRKKVLEWK